MCFGFKTHYNDKTKKMRDIRATGIHHSSNKICVVSEFNFIETIGT